MAQIKTLTSESLEATYRGYTPSQNGFTEDLQASNVVIPVIDLTPSSDGATGPEYLQTAWDFSTGSSEAAGNTVTLINNTGFWRVNLVAYVENATATARTAQVYITDSLTNKTVWSINTNTGAGSVTSTSLQAYDFTVFLRSGDSLVATTSNIDITLKLSYRQVADINGTLVYPSGYTPQ